MHGRAARSRSAPRGAATAERFTITLTPEERRPAPAADTVQVKGSGTAGFTGLTYTAPGDYRYTVRQSAGGTAHMTYDATVYTVTVRVTNQPGRRAWGPRSGPRRQRRKDRPAAVPEPVRPARRADAHACPGQNHPGSPRTPRPSPPAPNRRPLPVTCWPCWPCSLPVG